MATTKRRKLTAADKAFNAKLTRDSDRLDVRNFGHVVKRHEEAPISTKAPDLSKPKPGPKKAPYLERVAAAHTAPQRAKLVRAQKAQTKRDAVAAESTFSPRNEKIRQRNSRIVGIVDDLRAGGEVARATSSRRKRVVAADKVRAQMDAGNAADRRGLDVDRQNKLSVAGIRGDWVAGAASALGTDVLATGAAFAHDPIKQTGKTAKGLKDAAVGAVGGVVGLAKSGGELATSGHSDTGKQIIKAVGDDYSRRSGAAFRGESGALSKQIKRQRTEGSLPEILDIATVAGGPAGQAAAKGVRAAAKLAPVTKSTGRAAGAVKAVARSSTPGARPKLREAGNVITDQKSRKGIVGATAAAAHDATRARVQRKAVEKSKTPARPRLQPKAAATTKTLPLRRVDVKEGEVVALTKKSAGHRQRKRVAKIEHDARARTAIQLDRDLTGYKGPRDHPGDSTMRANYNSVGAENHDVVAMMNRDGIRSSEAAVPYIEKRLANIEAARALKPESAVGAVDNVPRLKALLKDPKVFDDPELHRIADIERRRAARVVGPAQGLSNDRKRMATIEHQAETLGVVRHRAESVEDLNVRVEAEIQKRSADILAKARGGGTGARKRAALELNILHEATGGVAMSGEKSVATLERAAIALGQSVRRKKDETLPEFEARAKEARDAQGLVEPGYQTSLVNQYDDAPQVRMGGGGSLTPNPLRERTGENFRMGTENHDPRLQEAQLAQSVRHASQVGARADILHKEGRYFDSKAAAREWLSKNNVANARNGRKKLDKRGADDAVIVEAGTGRVGQVAPAIGAKPEGAFVKTDAVYVVPQRVVDEFEGQLAPPGAVGHFFSRAASLQNAALLVASPQWIQFQLVADGGAAAAAGGLGRTIRAHRWYKAASDAEREQIDVLIGGGPANDAMVWDIDERVSGLTAALRADPKLNHYVQKANPLTAALRFDAAKNRALRRGVLLAKLERDARPGVVLPKVGVREARASFDELATSPHTAAIDKSITKLQSPMKWLTDVFGKVDPAESRRMLMDHPEKAVEAGEYVNKIMGDFSKYTVAERAGLRRVIPFYGFMRYSLRMALVTLPLEHPLVGTLIAQIGTMSANEARDLVGPDLPYGLSAWYNKDGSRSVDLARASPILNALTSIDKPGQFFGMMPPLYVIGADWASGKNLYRDADYHFNESLSTTIQPTPTDRARVAVHEALNLFGLVRDYDAVVNEESPQADTSLPWDRKYLTPASGKAGASFADRPKAGGSRLNRFLSKETPALHPERPTPNVQRGKAATENKKRAKLERTNSDARVAALKNDPLAQTIQRAKVTRARAKASAESHISPAVLALRDKINAERTRLGLSAR